MTEEKKPKVAAVPLREDEMVAIVIRSFFDVPEAHEPQQVIAKTDPAFVNLARDAVKGLMAYWAAKVRGEVPADHAEKALHMAGINPETQGRAN